MRIALHIPLVLAALSLAGCGSSTDPLPEDPYPLYWSIEEEGYIQGWASRSEAYCDCENKILRGTWSFPREPFAQLCEIELQRAGGSLSIYDWSIGPLDGPALHGRLMPEIDDEFAWLGTGWGDLALRRHLSASPPIPLDLRSPLSFELLGAAWDSEGRPDSLEVNVLRVGDPRKAGDVETARLHWDGQMDLGGFLVEAFHLNLAAETIHFKHFSEDFPRLWASQSASTILHFWTDAPPNIEAFAPVFPEPEGYAVEPFTLDAASGGLAGELLVPDESEALPAILMFAGAGPADRNQGALFANLSHQFAAAGYLVARFDKPGTGESGGDLFDLGLAARRQNLALVWDLIENDPRTDPERRVLLGYGEGGALALEAAAENLTAAAVVALSPWFSSPRMVVEIPEALPGRFDLLGLECFGGKHLDRVDFDPYQFLPELGIPALLTAVGRDETLPLSEVLALAEIIGTEAEIYLDFDGAYNATVPENPPAWQFTRDLLDWLAATLP